MFGDKLTRRRLRGNARDTRASVQWPAVKKTRADTSVPEQNSPNVPSACWVRIAPTFGWAVSIVPQVIAWDRDARATRRTTPNTPRNRDARAHRLPNDSTATLPSWEGMDEDVIKAWSRRTDSVASSFKGPVIPFPQQVPQQMDRPRPVDPHEECT